jgi:hypothetical protein
MEKHKNKIIDIFRDFIKHPIMYSFMILILIVIIINLIFFSSTENIKENDIIVDQLIFIKGITLQNWSIIMTVIGLYIGAVWAYFQFNKSIKSKQQEKGAAIAQYMSSNIIERISVIDYVFSTYGGMDNILKILMSQKDLKFNVSEAQKLFGNKVIEDFKKFYNGEDVKEKYQQYLKDYYPSSKIEEFPLNFKSLLITTLNEIECLCISISSNAAGSSFIYSSMQGVFLKFIQQSYPLISSLNIGNLDLVYLNVIYVYNYWFTQKSKEGIRLYSKRLKAQKIRVKMEKENAKAEREIEKLSYKKPEAV